MKVAVVDYGAGNVFSVAMALKHVGASAVHVSADGPEIARSDALILPGVGAFGDGMHKIRALHLEPVIAAFVRSGRPVLGICLGMQMLASLSEEFGLHAGLNLIPGKVLPLPKPARTLLCPSLRVIPSSPSPPSTLFCPVLPPIVS